MKAKTLSKFEPTFFVGKSKGMSWLFLQSANSLNPIITFVFPCNPVFFVMDSTNQDIVNMRPKRLLRRNQKWTRIITKQRWTFVPWMEYMYAFQEHALMPWYRKCFGEWKKYLHYLKTKAHNRKNLNWKPSFFLRVT